MKRIIGVVAAVVVLGGCAAPKAATKESGASAPVSSSTPDNGPTPDPITTPTNTPAVPETSTPPDDPTVAKVGATEWFTYEDGLKVQVTKVARYKVGEATATGSPGDPAIVVTVTIRNGSTKTADLSMTTLKVAYGANGDQAEQVYDENYGTGFEGSATPGKAKTAKYAFLVPKGRHALDIEVEPGFLDYESAHFEGSVK